MDFNGLIAQVVDTLGSQVTTAQATALLPFVEARFNRIVQHPDREGQAYATPTADITIPADCWELRDVWLVGTPDTTLEQMSGDQARHLYGMATGSPVAYVVSGSQIDFFPTPTSTSTGVVKIRYVKTIPALSASNTANWLMTSHPDIYYYGLLLQCEAYIVNDERLGLWKQALDEALSELGQAGNRRRHGASPIVMKAYASA